MKKLIVVLLFISMSCAPSYRGFDYQHGNKPKKIMLVEQRKEKDAENKFKVASVVSIVLFTAIFFP